MMSVPVAPERTVPVTVGEGVAAPGRMVPVRAGEGVTVPGTVVEVAVVVQLNVGTTTVGAGRSVGVGAKCQILVAPGSVAVPAVSGAAVAVPPRFTLTLQPGSISPNTSPRATPPTLTLGPPLVSILTRQQSRRHPPCDKSISQWTVLLATAW